MKQLQTFGAFLILSLLTGCAASSSYPPAPVSLQQAAQTERLQPGDTVQIIVYGEPDLSGEFILDNRGNLHMPLVGAIPVTGQTPAKASQTIAHALRHDYVRDPKVTLNMSRPRDVFILGEVQKPGSYPYVPGLSVIQAVAKAGGYSYRANHNDIIVRRDATHTYSATENTPLLAGDTITVGERFF